MTYELTTKATIDYQWWPQLYIKIQRIYKLFYNFNPFKYSLNAAPNSSLRSAYSTVAFK